MADLDDLKEAQRRVLDLQQQGADLTSPEARRAMNRLMGLLRQVSPEELAAFDTWKAEEQRKRLTD